MQPWEGKSKGTKTGYRIFIFTLRKLGLYPAYGLLIFVALYYFLFSPSSSIPIYRYFRKHHRWSTFKSLVAVYRNYFVFGQTLIDKMVVMAGVENKFTYQMEGEEYLHQLDREGKGGLLISAHVGNWEMGGQLFKRVSQSINIVMFEAEHRQIREYLDSVSQRRNYHIIQIKEDQSHIYQIASAFQRNELVCMHADRFIPGNKTAKMNFLGEAASFPLGPFTIAAVFRVPVSFVFAFKESLTHYHFYTTTPALFPREIKREEIIDGLLATFVNKLEEVAKKYPLQWFNYYDFWKA